jgi:predicted RNA binding protein YcfA (HicA-like mRNA interferase family)
MSKHAKTLLRLAATPTPVNIKWSDLVGALEDLGYTLLSNKGSRRKFIFPGTQEVISLHEPHPQPEVKQYAIRQVVDHLKLHGRI